MTRRFRVVAGPNGSGKTTLVARLASDYAVNFYTMLNADDVFAHVKRERAFLAPMPIDGNGLVAYVKSTQYADAEKSHFLSGEISVENDCVRFATAESINSYTIAMLVNFLQDECINRGISFSQETVLSHPSKVAAIKKAHDAGFRTYLYYVATSDAIINAARVSGRYEQGGHDVPPEKILARYRRSMENAAMTIPHLSRAFFFDNSGTDMKYLASYSAEEGFALNVGEDELPDWFKLMAATTEAAA